jgi:hypothetical protein
MERERLKIDRGATTDQQHGEIMKRYFDGTHYAQRCVRSGCRSSGGDRQRPSLSFDLFTVQNSNQLADPNTLAGERP